MPNSIERSVEEFKKVLRTPHFVGGKHLSVEEIAVLYYRSDITQILQEGVREGEKKEAERVWHLVNDGVKACVEDIGESGPPKVKGKELQYIFGKSQGLKVVRANIETRLKALQPKKDL